ncbi:DUF6114 domain-containing protein [Streptodolium elevatio]|uniref:DUF6114 domain-containing protein n=1 Tax=Streptodolium elevatio TaxID=3157996 RepID=A0ABV3DE09_9ACTN
MQPGPWLDRHLPFPKERRALRRWRRTRPFWGGVYLIAGGLEIMLIPMSPLSILITLGVGGLAALAIGSVLVFAGLCLWFLPAQRHFVSLVALVASVVSFAATNLGGFLVGMALGVLGSSMGFGWRPTKPHGGSAGLGGDASGPDDAASGDGRGTGDRAAGAGAAGAAGDGGVANGGDGAAGVGGAGVGGASDGSLPGERTSKRGGGPGEGRAGAAGVALAVPLLLVAASLGPGAGKAVASDTGCGRGGECVRPTLAAVSEAVTVGANPPTVTSSFFAPIGFAFAGVTEVPTVGGARRVLVLRMNAASLRDYRLRTRDGGPVYAIDADQLDLNGDVTIYVTRLYGCIEGLLCLTFSAEGLPLPPIIPPFVFMTRVEAEQALVTADRIGTDNLAIRAG